MNYLITGANGFVGRHLTAMLLAQGHSVNYLARKRSKSLDSRAAFFCWNTREEPPLDCIRGVEAIVNLAGEPVSQRWNVEVKREIRDSRVTGTRNLVSAIARMRQKPEVLVSASAIGYYGEQGDRVLPEDTPPGSGFLSEVCVEWEQEAERARGFGLRVVPIRISIVLGQDGGALPAMAAPFRYGLGGKLGSGNQWMPWVHIQDLVRMIAFAAENPKVSSVLNGAGPNPVTNKEFTRVLAKVLRRPAWLGIPKSLLRLAMGEIGDHILDSTRAVPKAALREGFRFDYPDLENALRQALLGVSSAPVKPLADKRAAV